MTVWPSSNWNTCQLVVANAPSRLALKHPPCSNVSSKELKICFGHDIGPNKWAHFPVQSCLHMFACCLSARHQNVWPQLVSPDKDVSAFQLMVMANLLDDKVLQSELEDSHSAAATPVCWPPVLRPCDWCQIIIHNLPFSAYQSD